MRNMWLTQICIVVKMCSGFLQQLCIIQQLVAHSERIRRSSASSQLQFTEPAVTGDGSLRRSTLYVRSNLPALSHRFAPFKSSADHTVSLTVCLPLVSVHSSFVFSCSLGEPSGLLMIVILCKLAVDQVGVGGLPSLLYSGGEAWGADPSLPVLLTRLPRRLYRLGFRGGGMQDGKKRNTEDIFFLNNSRFGGSMQGGGRKASCPFTNEHLPVRIV